MLKFLKNMYKLVRFSEISERQYEDYIQEWELSGEVIVPSATKKQGKKFKECTQAWKESETSVSYEKGFVPSTLYFLIENDEIVGAIHHRHKLNQKLLQNGGNIGYGVRPTKRGKGYASIMLDLLLKKIWEQGEEKVLITCYEDNIASAKTIEKNGGVLAEKSNYEGKLLRKYWITKNS